MTDLDFDGLVEMVAKASCDHAGIDFAYYSEPEKRRGRAILRAVLPHVLAGPREALKVAAPIIAGSGASEARRKVYAELARIDKLTEGMSREGETG